MPPPGRRKGYSFSCLLLVVFLVFSIGANAASAALGIDLGTEYIKAAIAKPGSPIEIVLTKDSKRKEAAALAFKPSRSQKNDQDAFPERLYGGDALALAARYPTDVYPNLKPLLGLPLDHETVTLYSKRYPSLQLQRIDREDGGKSIGFKSESFGKPDPFMVEELLAMELQNIKANAEALVGKNNFVTDVVITYPAFYTAEEKRAVQFAADLAGLRVLGLMSDGQAVGLNYATTRPFDTKKSDVKPEYHIVYDMGAGSTTATVLKFHARLVKGVGKKNTTVQEVQVLGTGYDRFLGGDHFNDLIVNDMIDKFLQSTKAKAAKLKNETVRKDGKNMARIWKEAERVRQILSANTQASASFEGLFDEDINFKYTLTRTEFEEMASLFASQMFAPLSSALTMADLTMEDISSVILFGGMTRTPFVQAELEKGVGDAKKVKSNINADEAAAFGAAFKAAGLSPSFRVKDIRTADISGSNYIMKWSSDGKERQQDLFFAKSLVGAEKIVTVRSTDDLQIEFWQASTTVPQTSQKILSVDAANLTKSTTELRNTYGCVNSNITTVFNIRLNPADGLPEILSGSVSCEAQKVKDGGVMDNVKGLFGFGSKKGDQQPLKGEDEKVDEDERLSQTPLPVDDPTSSGTIVSSTHSTTAMGATATGSTKSKPSTAIIPLLLKHTARGAGTPPRKALPVIKQRLTAFDNSDRNSVLRSEALNVLEAFTYRARDYLQDEGFMSFSTDAARTELEKQLSKISDWVYGDGTDAKLQDFKDRLKLLKGLVDPVLKRKEEKSGREKAIESFQSALSGAVSMMDAMKENIAQAAEKASSSASLAASSVAESVSSMISANGDDDLDDEPYATSTGSGVEATEAVKPVLYQFSQEELSSVEKVYNSAKSWFEEKLALQEKLTSFDDPALLVADLETKAKQLSSTVSDMIMKQIKMQQIPKPKKSKTSKKSKSKNAKSTAVVEESIVEETRATAVDESTPATKPSSTKDEL